MVEAQARPRLFSPGRMGRMELRNRVGMAPMGDGRAVPLEESGREETVGADLLILARGSMPEPTWLELLRRKVPEVHVVGDCVEPRIIADALYEGAWAGSRI